MAEAVKREFEPHALIIGGGVSGLTTAKVLLENGYKVSVIAQEYASRKNRITSQIAGALWEWPPAVCGRSVNPCSTFDIMLAMCKAIHF